MQYPDSPEGVAFGLMLLIVGALDPTLPVQRAVNEDEALRIYRRCAEAVRGEPSYISRAARLRVVH